MNEITGLFVEENKICIVGYSTQNICCIKTIVPGQSQFVQVNLNAYLLNLLPNGFIFANSTLFISGMSPSYQNVIMQYSFTNGQVTTFYSSPTNDMISMLASYNNTYLYAYDYQQYDIYQFLLYPQQMSGFNNITVSFSQQTFDLVFPYYPISNTAFTFTSSNESVATISGNTVTIVSSGQTQITASTQGIYETAILSVLPDRPVLEDYIPSNTTAQILFEWTHTDVALQTVQQSRDANNNYSPISLLNLLSFVQEGLTNDTLYLQYMFSQSTGGTQSDPVVMGFMSTSDTTKVMPSINWVNEPPQILTFSDNTFTLTNPESNSNGSWSYQSLDTSVISISGNTVTFVGAGTAMITAIQAETSTYLVGNAYATITVIPSAPTNVMLSTSGTCTFNGSTTPGVSYCFELFNGTTFGPKTSCGNIGEMNGQGSFQIPNYTGSCQINLFAYSNLLYSASVTSSSTNVSANTPPDPPVITSVAYTQKTLTIQYTSDSPINKISLNGGTIWFDVQNSNGVIQFFHMPPKTRVIGLKSISNNGVLSAASNFVTNNPAPVSTFLTNGGTIQQLQEYGYEVKTILKELVNQLKVQYPSASAQIQQLRASDLTYAQIRQYGPYTFNDFTAANVDPQVLPPGTLTVTSAKYLGKGNVQLTMTLEDSSTPPPTQYKVYINGCLYITIQPEQTTTVDETTLIVTIKI
jgi:hypothetical protein